MKRRSLIWRFEVVENRPKKRSSVSLGLFLAVLAGVGCGEEASWKTDIDRFASGLEARHPDLFFQVDRDPFLDEVETLRESSDEMTPQQIVLEMARIAAWMLGGKDSHTQVGLLQSPFFSTLPVRLQWFGDALHVVAVQSKHDDILGKKVIKIGEMPVADVLRETTKYITHANEVWAQKQSTSYMVSPELLFDIGATEDSSSATLSLEDEEGEVSSSTINASKQQLDSSLLPETVDNLPLYLQTAMHAKSFQYWYAYVEEEKTLYVHYFRCLEGKQPFEDFTDEVFALADAQAVEKLVLDIRNNSGGNSELIWPFIEKVKARPSLNRSESFFVIIGARTFSSALFACVYLDNETNATFVGEPTGGKPTNRFGEVSNSFDLPFSGVKIHCSAKYFDLAEKWDVKDNPSFLPDVEVKTLFEDYVALRDPVLEHIWANY